MEKIRFIIREFGVFMVVGLLGLGVVVYGLWGQLAPEPSTVEIIKGESDGEKQLIFVDIAGAVEKPGVYQLPSESRIGDALVMAGGLASQADREWVAKTMNLAEEIEDGEKIYIPPKSAEGATPAQDMTKAVAQGGKVNINTASLSDLDGLEGIGEVRAKTILDNRPYSKIDDLVSKAKIPDSVYEKIKDKISAY